MFSSLLFRIIGVPEERIDDKEGEGMEKCNERGGKKISRIDRLTASSTRSMVDDCFNIRIPYFNEKNNKFSPKISIKIRIQLHSIVFKIKKTTFKNYSPVKHLIFV